MPEGGRTGPHGNGPHAGKGFGYCKGYKSPKYTKDLPRDRLGLRGGDIDGILEEVSVVILGEVLDTNGEIIHSSLINILRNRHLIETKMKKK